MKKNIYVCGPTVYNNPHIGNLRPIITFDLFVRSLKHLGYDVNFIHNITDIDDKIIKKAQEENVSEKTISERYTKIYMDILKSSNVLIPNHMPKVTDNIAGIILYIKNLINNGAAYEESGNVFFEISKAKDYGSISNIKLNQMKTRRKNFYGKKNHLDFVLWKKTDAGIQFDSPWGKGRPGWHTECAQFIEFLGDDGVDIHGGGIDLLFPHHENENIQFKALHNKDITSEWFWTGHINVDNKKMSKSLGNVYDAKDFIKNHSSKLLRFIFLITSPSSPIDLTDTFILESKSKLDKLIKAAKQAQIECHLDLSKSTIADYVINWEFAKINKVLSQNLKGHNINDNNSSVELLANLSLLGFIEENDLLSKEDKKIYKEWVKTRELKDYETADSLRKKLQKLNII